MNEWKGKKSVTYKEARVYLDELSKYGSVLGLDTVRGLLRELGNPQDDLKFIHIAGTNGKGSVLAYTSTILSEAGYRIGRYVSPTVVSYLERIQVDGRWISEEKFAEKTAQVRDAIARSERNKERVPTVFEAETAIAFLYFREMKCNLVVLEAGLGGALDATNVVENTICAVFSSISRDHIGIIGNTLEEIAKNKAGILKRGCQAVSARQKAAVRDVLKRSARKLGCGFREAEPEQAEIINEDERGIRFSYKEYDGMQTGMSGTFQIENLTTALEVISALRDSGYDIEENAVKTGLERTFWPGRFQCIGRDPVFLLDGAHNEEAALCLRESVKGYFPGRKLICIVGVFRDKEYERIAEIMCPLASSVYTVDLPDRKRGLPGKELAKEAEKYCSDVRYFADGTCSDVPAGTNTGIRCAVRAALDKAEREDVILAFGSLSYLRHIKDAFDAERDQEEGDKV